MQFGIQNLHKMLLRSYKSMWKTLQWKPYCTLGGKQIDHHIPLTGEVRGGFTQSLCWIRYPKHLPIRVWLWIITEVVVYIMKGQWLFQNVFTEFLEGMRVGSNVMRRFESPVLLEIQFDWLLHKRIFNFSTLRNIAFRVIVKVSWHLNPLKTKRRPLYLKTQFVPCSKHFSSRL